MPHSIEANRGDLALEVIVVDNASSDNSVRMIQQEFPRVRLIASKENLGYTGGNNLGIKKAQGRYVLILNPDTEIIGNALQQMLAYLDQHPAVGVIGPQLLNPDGSVQSSRRRFLQPVTALFQGTYFGWRFFPNNRFERMHTMADLPEDQIVPVDWLAGAALMIRGEALHQVGPFDEQFFMYSDEVDWCHRCRDVGWEIHYLPSAQVIHHQGQSSKKVATASQVHFHHSRILYFCKYFGKRWGTFFRLYYMINYTFELVEETTRWIFGHRYEERRQRIQAYWHTLMSGFR